MCYVAGLWIMECMNVYKYAMSAQAVLAASSYFFLIGKSISISQVWHYGTKVLGKFVELV